MARLTLDNLAVGYRYPPILDGIDGGVTTGEWVHLHGRNGAGKTTLLKTMAGLRAPLEGELRWNDEPLTGPVRERYRSELRYFGHERALYQELSIRENWDLFSSLFDLAGSSDARLAGDLSRDRRVGSLSRGEQQRVELSTLWPSSRPVFIMDEPFASLDAESHDCLLNFLNDARDDGRLVLTASPRPIDDADRRWLLKDGELYVEP